MTTVNLKLPADCSVSNYLDTDEYLELLTQDLLAVELPNGFFIDVGWYPEHDPSGQYVVRVFWKAWEDQRIDPIRLRHIGSVVERVEALAKRFVCLPGDRRCEVI